MNKPHEEVVWVGPKLVMIVKKDAQGKETVTHFRIP